MSAQKAKNGSMNTPTEHVLRTDRSFDLPRDEGVEAALAEEIQHRMASIDRGEVRLIPSDEVFRSMRERLDGKVPVGLVLH